MLSDNSTTPYQELLYFEDTLQNIAFSLWPEIAGRRRARTSNTIVRPLVDLDFGDLTSSLCFDLAPQLNQEPSVVAEKIVALVPDDFPAVVHAQEGFLNLRLKDKQLEKGFLALSEHVAQLWSSSVQELEWGKTSLIIVAPRRPDLGRWEYLRIVARAFLQFYILKSFGQTVCFIVGEHMLTPTGLGLSLASIVRELVEIIDRADTDRTHPFSFPWIKKLSTDGVAVYLWLSSDPIRDRTQPYVNEIYASCQSVRSFCLERRLVHGIESDLRLSLISSWSDKELLSLVLYLASPRGATDLDLSVPRYEERENLLWYLGVTLERASLLKIIAQGTKSTDKIEANVRSLYSRIQYLPQYYLNAGRFGEVEPLITILFDLSDRFNTFLNDSNRRKKLEKGEISAHEVHLITGAVRVLSRILGFLYRSK